MKRKTKALVRTDYAYQDRMSESWWQRGSFSVPSIDGSGYTGDTFQSADTTRERADVNDDLVRVVTIRGRGLSTRTKASPKRTR